MKKFEYKTIDYKKAPTILDDDIELIDEINKLGKEGWELVEKINHQLLFKREINEGKQLLTE